jgi:2-iminobutanoate/2-iminopropanoate deaminase
MAGCRPRPVRPSPTSPPCDVAKTTVFMTHISDFALINEVYAEGFGDHRPARSAIAVAGLPMGGLVEIEAWARAAL